MLEIILIVVISQSISKQLKAKGRSAVGYVILFVMLWVGGEIAGAIFGVIVSGPTASDGGFNFTIWVFALIGAAIGGTIGYVIASSVPPVEKEQEYYDDSPYYDRNLPPQQSGQGNPWGQENQGQANPWNQEGQGDGIRQPGDPQQERKPEDPGYGYQQLDK